MIFPGTTCIVVRSFGNSFGAWCALRVGPDLAARNARCAAEEVFREFHLKPVAAQRSRDLRGASEVGAVGADHRKILCAAQPQENRKYVTQRCETTRQSQQQPRRRFSHIKQP